jgi:hypothetical protein
MLRESVLAEAWFGVYYRGCEENESEHSAFHVMTPSFGFSNRAGMVPVP